MARVGHGAARGRFSAPQASCFFFFKYFNKEALTWQVGGGAHAGGVGADPPAFQQGSEGPRLARRGGASETQGAAQGVDAALSPDPRSGGVGDLGRLGLREVGFTGGTPPGRRGQRHRARQSQLQEEQHQDVNAQEHVTPEVRTDLLIPPKDF